ncbi:AAA family ATPase [Kitasatospora sp. NPDC086009]|uniref:AAA family ATPase n=1 Tax=unclassified Kitasatospora TaxID=2633591 RepID=UPI0037CB9BC7
MAATANGAPVTTGALVPHTFMHNQLRLALRQARPARIMIDGPPGSGRTWNALDLAVGLVGPEGRIGVIDTSGGASQRYADEFRFAVLELTSFRPEDLYWALYTLGTRGCDVVIVDTYSPFWSGPGGLLELADAETAKANAEAAKRKQPLPGNAAGWTAVRPRERMVADALLAYPGHVIVTVNAITETVLEETASGRTVPRRHGTKLDQRQNVESLFDICFSLLPGGDHQAVVTKSHLRALDGQLLQLTERPVREIGGQIAEWAADGIDCAPKAEFYTRAYDMEATIPDLERLRGQLVDTRAHGMAAYNIVPRRVDNHQEREGDPIALGVLVARRLETLRANEEKARRSTPPARTQPPAPTAATPSSPAPTPARSPQDEPPPSFGGRSDTPAASLPEEIPVVGETDPTELSKAAVVTLLRAPGAWDEPFRLIEAWTRAVERSVLDERVFCTDGRYWTLRNLIHSRQEELKAASLFADSPA